MFRSRRLLLSLTIGFLALFAIYMLFLSLFAAPLQQEQAEVLLSKTLDAECYRYQITAKLQVGESTRDYFSLTGAKNKDAALVEGEVLGTPLSLVWENGLLYQKSGEEGSWQSHPLEELENAAELFQELDPASAFAYESIESFVYVGENKGEQGRQRQYCLTLSPTGWVDTYFTDVSLVIETNRWGNQLQSMELVAQNRENQEASIKITALFFDQNEDIAISAPTLP